MAEVTNMKLKVDNLRSKRCFNKIKELLCKFPEIRDQTFNEREDTVIIKVVCWDREMIRTRLFSRGGGIIKSIDFIPPAPPPAPAPAPAPAPEPPLPPEPALPPETALPPVPIPVTGYPAFIYLTGVCCKSCCGGRGGCPCHHGYGIPHQPPSYDGDVGLVPSYDGWASGCRCDRSYGCRCGLVIEENPTCTIM